MEGSGEGQISLTDPDARLMVVHSKVTVGYNAQVAVDARHSLIVEQQVTNACNDMGLLAPTTGAAMEALGVERIDAVADMGYHSGDDIVACEAVGITPYILRPHRGTAVGNGLFPKERFRYDPDADADHCPGGQVLDTRYASVTRGLDQAVDEPGRVPDARAGEGSRRVQPDGTRLQSQTGHHAHRCAGADPGGAGLIRGPISAAKTPDIAWPDVHPDLTSTQWMKIPNLAPLYREALTSVVPSPSFRTVFFLIGKAILPAGAMAKLPDKESNERFRIVQTERNTDERTSLLQK